MADTLAVGDVVTYTTGERSKEVFIIGVGEQGKEEYQAVKAAASLSLARQFCSRVYGVVLHSRSAHVWKAKMGNSTTEITVKRLELLT